MPAALHGAGLDTAACPAGAQGRAGRRPSRTLLAVEVPKEAHSCNGRVPVAYEQCGLRPDRRPILTELAIHQVRKAWCTQATQLACSSAQRERGSSAANLPAEACVHATVLGADLADSAGEAACSPALTFCRLTCKLHADPPAYLHHGHHPHPDRDGRHGLRVRAPGLLAPVDCHARPPAAGVRPALRGCWQGAAGHASG